MLLKRKAVVGTIGADAHMIGGWVVSKFLIGAGYDVTFLGAVVPQEEFVKAAVETKADVILVSSMYGMGLIDCEGLRQKCVDAGIGDIVLYAGGTVASARELQSDWPEIERRFREMGFNRVFPNTVELDDVLKTLKADLRINAPD